MATKIQLEQTRILVNEQLETLLSYSIEDLIREEELGTSLSFREIEEELFKINDLLQRVSQVDRNEVPYNILSPFNIKLKSFIKYFEDIINFSAEQSNASQTRKTIIANIQNSYDDIYAECLPILNVEILNNNNFLDERNKIHQLLSDIEDQKKASQQESDKKMDELNSVLESAKSAASQVGVSKHSTVFHNESEFHKEESRKWLCWTTVLLVTIAVSAVFLTRWGLNFTENSEIIQINITKIIILSTLFYGLSITNRNYRAHKHNAILNKHRQNALSTFETFSNAAGGDEQTKNAVLLETTHSIFSNQQTGYLKTKNDSESNGRIIEIFKNIPTKIE